METSIAIWFIVAASMACLILIRTILTFRHKAISHRRRHKGYFHIISIGTEREVLWIPGDKMISNEETDERDED